MGYSALPGLITMVSVLVIFFVEFASTRYLSYIDEKVMDMRVCEEETQTSILTPITSLLSRQRIVMGGKRIGINDVMAGEPAVRAAESIVSHTPNRSSDETTPLMAHEGVAPPGRNDDVQKRSPGRRDSHSGHHHYYPPPLDTSGCPEVSHQSQLLAIMIMEGGLCFHSIFVGLTLAVARGGGFYSLFTAITFHRTLRARKHELTRAETFEGMGLGARIATLSFPPRSVRPYVMGLVFASVTPLGMGIGLCIRSLYSPTSTAALITTGVFDAISSGLLIYVSLVELLADEFLSGEMRFEQAHRAICAGICIVTGAVAMSLLGLWV
jgi:solute carrier family 39 (zinc transporter), member 1/2/3